MTLVVAVVRPLPILAARYNNCWRPKHEMIDEASKVMRPCPKSQIRHLQTKRAESLWQRGVAIHSRKAVFCSRTTAVGSHHALQTRKGRQNWVEVQSLFTWLILSRYGMATLDFFWCDYLTREPFAKGGAVRVLSLNTAPYMVPGLWLVALLAH